MNENTNKALLLNSMVMYAKLGITTVLSLLATRFALQALGISDFGLYSVCASIISFIGVFNGMMGGSCNRYLAVAVGKEDLEYTNKVFNVTLTLFFWCALFMLFASIPIGFWYINTHINYDGPISNALIVFYLSVIGSVLSTLGCPYNGLLIAKERFFVFSIAEVICSVIKCAVAYALLHHFDDKLMVYSITIAATTALPTFAYWGYCRIIFSEIIKWKQIRDMSLYKEILSFSGWIGFGSFAYIARNQGAALLVNAFFYTVMNTAMGIANSLNAFVQMFANNISQPMTPQITKSYAASNSNRTDDLLVMATKFTFMLMLLCGAPFFVACDWILQLWLGEVPPFAASFTILMIIDTVVNSFNIGISSLIFASGNIKWYQIITSVLRLLAIVVAYIVLKNGAPPQGLYFSYIGFSLISVIAIQIILHKTLGYDNMILVKRSYVPSLIILFLYVPSLFLNFTIHPILKILISVTYLLILEFLIGLSKAERSFIITKVRRNIIII